MREYAEKVREIVAEMIDEQTEVVEVSKMNEPDLVGVCIRVGNVGANFYINDAFNGGVEPKDIADDIVEQFNHTPIPRHIESMDLAWENIKGDVTLRLLGKERNKEFLENMVWADNGKGLAMIADINIGDEFRIPITKELAAENGYIEAELFKAAMENTRREFPAKLVTISSALFGGEVNLLEEDGEADEMMVLTNRDGNLGAVVLMYDGVQERIREVVGGSYYVLPSSIHEVLIVPAGTMHDAKALKEMVVTANNTVVDPRDVLNDSVYFYDGELKEVA